MASEAWKVSGQKPWRCSWQLSLLHSTSNLSRNYTFLSFRNISRETSYHFHDYHPRPYHCHLTLELLQASLQWPTVTSSFDCISYYFSMSSLNSCHPGLPEIPQKCQQCSHLWGSCCSHSPLHGMLSFSHLQTSLPPSDHFSNTTFQQKLIDHSD